MLSQASERNIWTGLILVLLLAVPSLVHADWSIGIGVGDRDHHDRHDRDFRERHEEHHYYRWHEHPHYGYRMNYISDGFSPIWVGGIKYYYYDGLFYIREGFEYVLVQPPVGAYVSAIPSDFRPVSINGRIYYTDNGVYYLLTEHHGYRVVQPPLVYEQPVQVVETQPAQVVVTQTAPAPVVAAPVESVQDTFPVNVPNKNGGYTAVLIKKSGNGYVGPQGEFYASFPTVSQLKVMYGK